MVSFVTSRQSWLHVEYTRLSCTAFEVKASCSQKFYCFSSHLKTWKNQLLTCRRWSQCLRVSGQPSSSCGPWRWIWPCQGPIHLWWLLLHMALLLQSTIAAKGSKTSPPELVATYQKYNEVIFGINESEQGTPCFAQWNSSDLTVVQPVLTSVEEGSGHTPSVHNCCHMQVNNKAQFPRFHTNSWERGISLLN